jgi:two-component system OmpR family sensor kinase
MAQQMQVQMRLIEQSDSSRREFFANVSHDLRTPLASIQGYLETLSIMNDSLASTDRQQYLQIALSQSRSLSHLIDTLFYLAKLDSGQIALQPEQFRIEEVVQDVVQKFALQAQKQNIRLEMDGCDKLPFVCADLGLIERALSNLIDNALRHTLEGGSVRLRMQHIDKKIWVSVIDSSGGISESDLPHIFERFYRGHGVLGNAAVNAGIGLSIVSRIVAMHGETVEAGNALGLGAEFRFSLSVVGNKDAPCRREQFPA